MTASASLYSSQRVLKNHPSKVWNLHRSQDAQGWYRPEYWLTSSTCHLCKVALFLFFSNFETFKFEYRVVDGSIKFEQRFDQQGQTRPSFSSSELEDQPIEFLTLSQWFFFDSIPCGFASHTYRLCLLGVASCWSVQITFKLWMYGWEEDVNIPLFNDLFIFNIQSIARSTFIVLTTFIIKNFIFSYVYPNSFVMLTTSLQKKNF